MYLEKSCRNDVSYEKFVRKLLMKLTVGWKKIQDTATVLLKETLKLFPHKRYPKNIKQIFCFFRFHQNFNLKVLFVNFVGVKSKSLQHFSLRIFRVFLNKQQKSFFEKKPARVWRSKDLDMGQFRSFFSESYFRGIGYCLFLVLELDWA